jgi:hypothetical protein
MKRCTTNCALCKETDNNDTKRFVVTKPRLSYEWCVYRHPEPLSMGEYEIEVKSNGDITGTICYRSRVVPKGKRQRKRRTKNECPRCGYKWN